MSSWSPEKSRELPLISEDSRLLWERNIGVKGRVDEAIRARTAKQSERIRNKTKNECAEIKDSLFNQFSERLEKVNKERSRQNHYWRMKTKDSPYRYDQNEVDLRNAEILHDKKSFQEKRKKRLRKIKAMTGEPFFDFYTNKLRQSLGTEERLAMEHFHLTEKLKVVKKEQATLEDLLHQDCDRVETEFAAVALQLAAKRAEQRMGKSDSFSMSMISGPKISSERARELKEQDNRLYQAEGRWNESGQFVPARTEQDKVGLVSSRFALSTGNKSSKNLVARKKDYGRLVEV